MKKCSCFLCEDGSDEKLPQQRRRKGFFWICDASCTEPPAVALYCRKMVFLEMSSFALFGLAKQTGLKDGDRQIFCKLR